MRPKCAGSRVRSRRISFALNSVENTIMRLGLLAVFARCPYVHSEWDDLEKGSKTELLREEIGLQPLAPPRDVGAHPLTLTLNALVRS